MFDWAKKLFKNKPIEEVYTNTTSNDTTIITLTGDVTASTYYTPPTSLEIEQHQLATMGFGYNQWFSHYSYGLYGNLYTMNHIFIPSGTMINTIWP